MSGIPWTDKETYILKAMAKKGYTPREISRVLKSRTGHSIHCKADTLGLSLGIKEVEIDEAAFKRLMGGK
jgi:hypothetical protein